MIRLKQTDFINVQALAEKMLKSSSEAESVEQTVLEILQDVKAEGDTALLRYNAKFAAKDVAMSKPLPLRVEQALLDKALQELDSALKEALIKAAANIRAYHSRQVESDWMMEGAEGSQLGMLVRPMERVALYIPGGTAAYPSTVLMNVIPAQLAGVESIFIVTPPGDDGEVNPVVLATANLLGITEVYRVGGAQAVAAAAYGTASIKKADKIVGPGNKYVATAKQKVYGQLDIDMVAGPSEVLIVADGNADPAFIAADLLAQAEHDVDARMILVTTSTLLIDQVEQELMLQQAKLPRQSILKKSLAENCWAIEVPDLTTAMAVSNAVAPEHLEILWDNPEKVLPMVRHAGSVFLGAYSPEAVGDYYAGTNHTLPTSGTARFSSPLGVYDFIKRTAVTSYTAKALLGSAADIMIMADAEGLKAHGNSVAVRLEKAEAASDSKAASDLTASSELTTKLVRLCANENPNGLQKMISTAWYDELLPALQSNRYPDETYQALRAAIATYAEVPADNLVCGNGSDELIRLLVETYTTENGGGVLTPGPTFGEYARAAAHKGSKFKELQPCENFGLDFDNLFKTIEADKPELIFICSPNNPTGEPLAMAEILNVCDATEALVVVDEAYYEFNGETVMDKVMKRSNLVVLRTLSKAFGMAGLRVGYGAAPTAIINELNKRRMPYNVNVVAEQAAIMAVQNRKGILDYCGVIRQERDRLIKAMDTFSNLEVYPSKGNFILFAMEDTQRQNMLAGCQTAGVEIRSYEKHPLLKGCLRVSIGQADENDLFLQILAKTSKDQDSDSNDKSSGRQIS